MEPFFAIVFTVSGGRRQSAEPSCRLQPANQSGWKAQFIRKKWRWILARFPSNLCSNLAISRYLNDIRPLWIPCIHTAARKSACGFQRTLDYHWQVRILSHLSHKYCTAVCMPFCSISQLSCSYCAVIVQVIRSVRWRSAVWLPHWSLCRISTTTTAAATATTTTALTLVAIGKTVRYDRLFLRRKLTQF